MLGNADPVSQRQADPTARRIAIIGAGASGLCAAKWLGSVGIRPTIYEAGSHVGGVWVYDNDSGRSPAYKTLCINTDKRTTQFADHPFTESTSLFPHHTEMRSYLDSYADRFRLRELIRFNTTVQRIERDPGTAGSDQRWIVHDGLDGAECYDSVIVANGHAAEPREPELRHDFTGEYLHSFRYRDPAPFAHKRVLIIGAGNSGFDIATDICMSAAKTVIAMRSGVVLLPKFFYGRPLIEIRETMARYHVPRSISEKVIALITRMMHGNTEALGFRKPIRRSRPTSNATIVTHVAYRRVTLQPAATAAHGRQVTFADGSSEEFDVMIAATGYKISVPFFDPDTVAVNDSEARLYLRMLAPGADNVYFIGLLQYIGAFFKAFDIQAEYISTMIAGKCGRPSDEQMWAAIERREAEVKRQFNDSPRHYLEEDAAAYERAVRAEIARGRPRGTARASKPATTAKAVS
jgi:dimethylaniline monooxygenase (N-oxide forming)